MKKLLLSGAIACIILIFFRGLSMDDVASTVDVFESEEEEEEERESGADKSLGIWWWSRAYPEPGDINEKFYQGWLRAQELKKPEVYYGTGEAKENETISTFSGNWQAIGPDQNIGGRILSIAIDPQNGNNLFIGSASGGIWRSTSGGVGTNAWQPVFTGLPVLGVASIIIDPANSNIIYAGTGEVYRTDTSNIGFNVWKARGTYGIGILKSIDRGSTWSRVFSRNLSGLFGIQMLKFHPSNSNIVFACATDGLYRTTNAGSTWTKILDKIYVSDLAINPTNPNLLVAAVGNLQNIDKGIYRSTDGGTNWTKITSGLPTSFQGFIRLDNVPANQQMIIASIGRDAGSSNELYRSNDFGSSWSVLSNSNHCQYQFWFAHDVAINPSTPTQLVMGGVPLFRYNLSNSSPSSVRNVHADIHDIEFDPSNSNVVYVACDGGMYKSTNGGSAFSMINGGLKAVQFYASFAVSPIVPNLMIGGLQDNGVVRYNGTGWTTIAGGDGGPCMFHPTNSAIVFASNDARRLLRSTNAGNSFTEVLSSWAFTADSRTAFMSPIAISKSNPNMVYAGSDNLHKSTTGGVAGSWNGNNYTTATNYIEAQHKTSIALAVSPLNANKIYISTSPFAQYDNDANSLHVNTPPNVFKSTNGGTSFINIKNGLPDRFVMDFAISPTNDDSVWIVLGGFGTPHIYVSGNGGLSWTNKGSTLPDVPHNAILLDPRNSSIIYVGNDLGVYISPDGGATWQDYNTGFWDATLVMDLAATANLKLVAATHGKGAFISDLMLVNLPVELINFSGQNQNSRNYIHWSTSTETNCLGFELERSRDGISYERITTIPCKSSATGSLYEFYDYLNGVGDASNLFYRLKILEMDGSFTYSSIVAIRMNPKDYLIVRKKIFNEFVEFDFNSRTAVHLNVRLFNSAGQCVLSEKLSIVAGTSKHRLNGLGKLSSGQYTLSIQTGKLRLATRLTKL